MLVMKILLSTIHSRYSQVSLALPYLYANLDNNVEKVIKEYNINMQKSDILESIMVQNADIVCFSCYIWNLDITLQICDVLKQINPETIILLGGPEVSYDCEYIFKDHSVNYIICGEGEFVLRDLIRSLLINELYPDIKGLCYRKDNNIVITSPAFVDNIDNLNLPWIEGLIDNEKNFIYYETSRGCPFLCKFCLSGINGKVRNYSMDNVRKIIDEITSYDFSTFRCIDRTFNLDSRRAIQIMDYILKKRKKNQIFQFEIKADLLDEDFFEFLKKIPKDVFQFEIGVQSLDDEVLRESGRKENISRLMDNIYRIIKSEKIFEHIDLICGLPKDKGFNFINTIKQILTLNPYKIQINTLKLLKGSDFYNNKEKYGLVCWQTPPYEIIKTDSMSIEEIREIDELSKIINIFYNSGYLRKTFKYISNQYDAVVIFFDILNYFKKNSIKTHSVSRINVFRIMKAVIKENEAFNIREIHGLLNLDFVESSKDFKANDIERITDFKFNTIKDNVWIEKNKKTKINSEVDLKTRFKLSKHVHIYNSLDFCFYSPHTERFESIYYFDFSTESNIWVKDENDIDIILSLSEESGQSAQEMQEKLNIPDILKILKKLHKKKIIQCI